MQERQNNIDRELILLCIRGDERATCKLYHSIYGALHAVCRRYLNDADEISQLLNTGFLKILNGLNRYQSKVPFEAWIKRIMINTLIDHHRKNKKYKELIQYSENVPEPKSAPFNVNHADKMFDAEQLMSLIKKLPPMTNKVFNLGAIDGYSHKEISQMLGISEGTSKWHLSNARTLLKEMMASFVKTKKKSSDREVDVRI